MEVIERTLSGVSQLDQYRIESISYTEQNFIMALDSQQPKMRSKIILISRDFAHISPAKSVDLRLISVTTDLAIDTADGRGIKIPQDDLYKTH